MDMNPLMQFRMASGESADEREIAAHQQREGVPSIRTDHVYVVFTTVEETLAAVRVADEFARALHVPLTVVHFRTVPYPLTQERPTGVSPVEAEEFVGHIRLNGFNLRSRVFLCRDERQALPTAFKAHSLVVIGGRHHWWPTAAERMRKTLEEAGHYVVFVDSKESAHA